MKVIYVDDEELAICRFTLLSQQIDGLAHTICFTSAEKAKKFCATQPVDLAFLDINMPGTNGTELARQLKDINPDIKIVFLTAYPQYALDAYNLDAIGYLVKPFSQERLQNEVNKARRMKNAVRRIITVQTIPRFDVFVDGEPLVFPGQKAKELLALIVDKNGGEVTGEYAITYLWENRPYSTQTKNLYRVLKKTLLDTLKQVGASGMLLNQNGKVAANKTMFYCDLYEILSGSKEALAHFHGQYMFDYSWAENTTQRLQGLQKN